MKSTRYKIQITKGWKVEKIAVYGDRPTARCSWEKIKVMSVNSPIGPHYIVGFMQGDSTRSRLFLPLSKKQEVFEAL